jgi:hypothetical protein
LVDAVNEEPSADLLTPRMQVHEKTAWMLRSLLEEEKSRKWGIIGNKNLYPMPYV